MLNTDVFKQLEDWSSMGDVFASIEWSEAVGPDERYQVNLVWRFRGDRVGDGQYTIEPIPNGEGYRLYWLSLSFIPEWQGKDIYTNLVKSYAAHLPAFDIHGVSTLPLDKESERRLATQGFEWDGHEFYLDFHAV